MKKLILIIAMVLTSTTVSAQGQDSIGVILFEKSVYDYSCTKKINHFVITLNMLEINDSTYQTEVREIVTSLMTCDNCAIAIVGETTYLWLHEDGNKGSGDPMDIHYDEDINYTEGYFIPDMYPIIKFDATNYIKKRQIKKLYKDLGIRVYYDKEQKEFFTKVNRNKFRP